MDDSARRPGPLHGVKVLDLSRFAPGALCTLLLADLGADVLKVEAPGAGDGNRGPRGADGFETAHVALNRGKRSIALDLRADGAAEVLIRLVGWADVLVESHRPGQLDSLGLGYDAVCQHHQHIVWCSITGFGDHGPNAGAAGHDLTYLGVSGLLDQLADTDPTPPGVGVSIPLAATLATTGILSGLMEARRTGRGTRLDANMTDSALWVLAEDVARVANDAGPGWGTFAARNVYRCADGRFVVVCATEPRTWATLCDALGLDDLAGHRLGLDDDGAATARLAATLAAKPAADWLADPGFAGGVGPVNRVDELIGDPQVVERDSLITLAGSSVRVLANPLRFLGASGTAASHAAQPPPDLGADTDDALAAAGVGADEVARLRAARVVTGPPQPSDRYPQMS